MSAKAGILKPDYSSKIAKGLVHDASSIIISESQQLCKKIYL